MLWLVPTQSKAIGGSGRRGAEGPQDMAGVRAKMGGKPEKGLQTGARVSRVLAVEEKKGGLDYTGG